MSGVSTLPETDVVGCQRRSGDGSKKTKKRVTFCLDNDDRENEDTTGVQQCVTDDDLTSDEAPSDDLPHNGVPTFSQLAKHRCSIDLYRAQRHTPSSLALGGAST